MTTDTLTPRPIAANTGRTKAFPSALAQQLFYWRIRRALKHDGMTAAELAALYGYSERMIHHIARTATKPDLHGLDEATALAVSAADVPVRVGAHLIVTHRTQTTIQQGQALGLHEKTIRKYRSSLYRAGLLDQAASVYTQRLERSRMQTERVVRLLRSGQGVTDVMEATGLSKLFIYELCEAHGGVAALRASSGIISLAAAATLLGMSFDALRQCVDLGYLIVGRHAWNVPGATDGARTRYRKTHTDRSRFCVTRADLYDFLRERYAWPRYSVHTIADPDLKQYAALQQRTAGGVWRSRNELAHMAGVHEDTAALAIKRGWLTGWEQTIFGRVTFYWHPNGVVVPTMKAR